MQARCGWECGWLDHGKSGGPAQGRFIRMSNSLWHNAEPTPSPSEEGSRERRVQKHKEFPSWEGLGVGLRWAETGHRLYQLGFRE